MILGIAPEVRLVDVSHEVASYDVMEGAFVLSASVRHFPAGTVHLGVVDPGVGSERRPIAASDGRHMFVGPDSSLIHPGIFPHNPAAQALATLPEWLEFDYAAGWGSDEFEDRAAGDYGFPEHWSSVADRYEAREIVEENSRLLKEAAVLRKRLLQTGCYPPPLGRFPFGFRFASEVRLQHP